MKRKQAAIFAIVVAVVIGALAFVAFGNLGDNLVYYWIPSEVLARADHIQGQTVRLGGFVAPGSVKWDAQALHLEFKVADKDAADAATILVDSNGAPPQMFRERIGVVVEGTIDGQHVFHSDRVLVNHSNEYKPPKSGEKPQDGYGEATVQK